MSKGMNYEPFRRGDFSIDLKEAWEASTESIVQSGSNLDGFFEYAESLWPIKSRQVATSILLMADLLVKRDNE